MEDFKFLPGDNRASLKTLKAGSVQCCITSPPYYGLRDYGTAQWIGGDPKCQHEIITRNWRPGTKQGTNRGSSRAGMAGKNECRHCGARRDDKQIGLERTPEQYVAELVNVFREVRRVLRDDGTLWINIGDSYASGTTGRDDYGFYGGEKPLIKEPFAKREAAEGRKPKDMTCAPWLLGLALRKPYIDWRIKTESMRGWVAGLVDGDGCITITKTKSKHGDSFSFPPIIQVRMCDLDALQKLADVAGSEVGNLQYPPSHAANNQRGRRHARAADGA